MQPIILPAVEKVQDDRFTISAIKSMIKIFRNESEAGVSIKNNRLLMLLEELSVTFTFSADQPKVQGYFASHLENTLQGGPLKVHR